MDLGCFNFSVVFFVGFFWGGGERFLFVGLLFFLEVCVFSDFWFFISLLLKVV